MKDHNHADSNIRWAIMFMSLLLLLVTWPGAASAEQKPAFPNAPKNSNYVAAVTANPKGGEKAALTIHVMRKSACELLFQGPAGLTAGPVKGRFAKKGFGSWSWRVPRHARKGTWTAKVRCQQGKSVKTLRTELYVAGKSKKPVAIAGKRGFKFVVRTTVPSPNTESNWGKGAGGYPDDNAVDCSATFGIYSWCKGGTWLSPRGFAYRNCTDFVSWYMGIPRSKFGFPAGVGNAADWKAYANRAGLVVTGSPSVGDIAWWGSSVAGGFGHVAIVTAVASNGTVTIAEYNGDGHGNYGIRPNMRAQAYLHLPGSGSPGGAPSVPFSLSALSPSGFVDGIGAPTTSLAADFNGDSRTDLAWYENGRITFYISNGSSVTPSLAATGIGPPQEAYAGDFNGDRKSDLAWYENGRITFYISNGSTVSPLLAASGVGPPENSFVGDFNGDGKSDLAWYENGRITFYISNGSTVSPLLAASGVGPPVTSLAADFNGDGKSDLAWYENGRITFYISNGSTVSPLLAASGVGPPENSFVGDFNGDGKSDLALYSAGRLTLYQSNGASVSPVGYLDGIGSPSEAFSGDFNGDGRSDLAWYENGRITFYLSHGSSLTPALAATGIGAPVEAFAGDVSLDGKTDLFWYSEGRITTYLAKLSN